MARNYKLTQTGQAVQDDLNKIEGASIEGGTIHIGGNSITPLTEETDPTVPAWAKDEQKPSYTADEVGALPDDTTLADLPDDDGHRTVSDAEKDAWDAKSDFSGNYPDLTNKPDLSQFITRSVNDLVNYYLKNEVYTKDEVADLLAGIIGGIWVSVSVLPQPSADTYGLKIYLVPSQEPATQNQKDEFITTRTGSEGNYSYAWEQIGTTAIDLSDCVTNDDLQSALEDYVSTEAFQQALDGKQDTLVSGENIKTINNQSILGNGNIEIQGGGSDPDAVKYTPQTLTEVQKGQARTNIGAPSTDDLENIQAQELIPVTTLPTASADTMGKQYLVGPDANNEYARYVTSYDGTAYSWVPYGTTALNLSGYATDEELDQLEQKVDGQESNIVYGESYNAQGTPTTNEGWFRSEDYVPVTQGDSVVWNPGAIGSNGASLIVYNGNKEVLDYFASLSVERTLNLTLAGTAYIRACFAETNKQNAKLIVNGAVVWTPVDAVAGLTPAVSELAGRVTTLESNVSGATELLSKVAVHHKETTVKTAALAVASGGQNLFFHDTNIRPGRTYKITIESNTDNTGYIRMGGYDVTNTQTQIHTGNINQNIKANPYTVTYTPTINLGRMYVYIRGVAVAGTLTLTIVEEWDEVLDPKSENVLFVSPGKNMVDPAKMITPRMLADDNGNIYVTTQNAGGKYITGYIPIKDGQTLVCNQSTRSNTNNRAALFKEKGDLEPIPGTDVLVNTDVVRTITNNLGYDAYAVFLLSATPENVQVEDGSTVTAFEPYSAIAGYLPSSDIDMSSYGEIGINYQEEVEKVILSIDNNHKDATKLHFVHCSDNHGSNFGYADAFTDPSPASFLVNTGDLVTDKFSDSFDTTRGLILGMTKPGFIVLGNHDVYQATSLQARFQKYFQPLNDHNGLTGSTKTYYSVDYATEKVKCIFLDMNDGYDDTTGLGMNYFIAGKMSSEQINWFATELQSAKTNGYDVAVFIHVSPDYVDTERMENSFYDGQVGKATGVSFLCDMVDGFINGGTVSFTADEVDYSFTFVAGGNFAGWFCGHTHHDCYGWLKDHPKQFSCSVARPYRNTDVNDGTYRIPKLGVTWDYVTINAHTHTMSILRMGNNETIYGTMRDAFYIKY